MKTKLYIYFLAFVIGVNISIAQEPTLVPEHEIINLNEQIKNHKKDDKEKVRLLNEFARLNFYNENYMAAFQATVDARDISEKIKYKGGEIMYHYTLAVFFGYGDLYTYHIQKARILSSQYEDIELIEEAEMPSSYRPTAISPRIEKLIPVYEHFKKLDEKEIYASIDNQLGYWYYTNNQFDKLKIVHRDFIKVYLELGEYYPVMIYYGYMNHVANLLNDTNEKMNIEQEIKNLASGLSNDQMGPINFLLANFYRDNEQEELAIKHYLNSVKFFESEKNLLMLAEVYGEMGLLYQELEMHTKYAEVIELQVGLLQEINNPIELKAVQQQAVWAMLHAKRFDDARMFMNILLADTNDVDYNNRIAQSFSLEGEISMYLENYKDAIPNLKKALAMYIENGHPWSQPWVASHIAFCYYMEGELDNALVYALLAFDYTEGANTGVRFAKRINLLTSQIYDALGNKSFAYDYLKKYQELISESGQSESNEVMETLLSSVMEQSQEEIDQLEQERTLKEQQNKTQRLWLFSIAGALLSALLIALILYRNNKQKQLANVHLKRQKAKVEQTLDQLKATQSQLIQSEKMASLGELTAGIAHEIQNPLNFVNNFSEISNELVEEVKSEMSKGKNERDEELENELLDDISENLKKITHHGKRAEAIVKGMLQHSQSNTGEKEPTDINALCDEYLRLSYHGLRAKDKSFNAEFKMEADETLPKINVVPQDIGRVFLNLINNAFYAVDKKARSNTPQPPIGGAESSPNKYKPEVVVRTSSSKSPSGDLGVNITVTDNGEGIPSEIKDKIFQPFFTTKPTGSGTGLGLSLSYDIVKAHGGKIVLNSKEEQGTSFIISLPVN